jgi:hypothetical protein
MTHVIQGMTEQVFSLCTFFADEYKWQRAHWPFDCNYKALINKYSSLSGISRAQTTCRNSSIYELVANH